MRTAHVATELLVEGGSQNVVKYPEKKKNWEVWYTKMNVIIIPQIYVFVGRGYGQYAVKGWFGTHRCGRTSILSRTSIIANMSFQSRLKNDGEA